MVSRTSFGVWLLACVLASMGCKGSKQARPPAATLGAAAAGSTSSAGPGVPKGFSGTITHSIALTDEERAAIEEANELSQAREAENQIHTSLYGASR